MYSRQNAAGRTSTPWQIPKNYSGNAFSPPPDPSVDTVEAETVEETRNNTTPSSSDAPVFGEIEQKHSPFGLSRKGGGIGLEELLILGLALLISQSDEGDGNNDLAFLLLLLLFIQ